MSTALLITIDFKDANSYLALGPTLEMLDACHLKATWAPFLLSPLKAHLPPAGDADRSEMHRWHRARYYQQTLVRYAGVQQIPARHFATDGLYRESSGEIAAMALNWVAADNVDSDVDADVDADQDTQVRLFMRTVFREYWDGDLSLDSVDGLVSVLESIGTSAAGFAAYCEGHGRVALNRQRDILLEAGCFSSPTYCIGEDLYLGRQHLPLIRERLQGVSA